MTTGLLSRHSGLLLKGDNIGLSERYTITCDSCGFIRQIFGTEEESVSSALKMGWEFRRFIARSPQDLQGKPDRVVEISSGVAYIHEAYCPHCKLLVKAIK